MRINPGDVDEVKTRMNLRCMQLKLEDVTMFFLKQKPLVDMLVRFGNILKKENFTDYTMTM